MKPAVLYLDLASPYAYLAAERARTVLRDQVEFQPVLLGALFKLRGRGSWAATESRGAGMAEVEDRARRYGLPPVVWPRDWPLNSLAADRAAIWAKTQGAADEFMRCVYRQEFAQGADISSLGPLQAAAAEVGLDPDEVPDAIQRPEVKASLRDATDEAWQLGVCGVPSVRIGEEIFWGDDKLELAAGELGADSPRKTAGQD